MDELRDEVRVFAAQCKQARVTLTPSGRKDFIRQAWESVSNKCSDKGIEPRRALPDFRKIIAEVAGVGQMQLTRDLRELGIISDSSDVSVKPENDYVLYRCWDDAGTLLYVGLTIHFPGRFKNRDKESPWWREVIRIELERFVSKEELDEAETKAIQHERPVYNDRKTGVTRTRRKV